MYALGPIRESPVRLLTRRFRANLAQEGQSRTDFGLDLSHFFRQKSSEPFKLFPWQAFAWTIINLGWCSQREGTRVGKGVFRCEALRPIDDFCGFGDLCELGDCGDFCAFIDFCAARQAAR